MGRFRFSAKRMVLMSVSFALMILSNFVDGEIMDEDTREIVQEELLKLAKKED